MRPSALPLASLPALRLTGNPGGPGHNWVKAATSTPALRGYKIITEETKVEIDGILELSVSRVFIPSSSGTTTSSSETTRHTCFDYANQAPKPLSAHGSKATGQSSTGHSSPSSQNFSMWFLLLTFSRAFPQGALRFRFDWGSAKPFSVGWYVVADGAWGIPDREHFGVR